MSAIVATFGFCNVRGAIAPDLLDRIFRGAGRSRQRRHRQKLLHARKDIEKFGEYRTKRLCLEAYDHFAPETLRELELEVREVEVGFRRLIDLRLDGNIDDLPPNKKDKLLENYRRSLAAIGSDRGSALRDLLEWATLEDLDPILRSELVWQRIGRHFDSKRKLVDYLGWLRNFRNPLVHSRGLRGGPPQGRGRPIEV